MAASSSSSPALFEGSKASTHKPSRKHNREDPSPGGKPQQSTFGPSRGRGLTVALGVAATEDSAPAADSTDGDSADNFALAGSATISASVGAAVTAEMKRNRSYSTAVTPRQQTGSTPELNRLGPAPRPSLPDAWVGMGEETVKCVALRAFRGEREDDLAFDQGDVVEVARAELLKAAHWCHGRCKGRSGLFPTSHVRQPDNAASPASPLLSGGVDEAPSLLPTTTSSDGDEGSEFGVGTTNGGAKEAGNDVRLTEEDISDADGELTYEDVDEEGVPGRTTKVIASGPRGKLIEALVIPRTIPEPFYTEAFLLTRAYFISSRALLNRLIHFFLHYQEPNGAKEDPADVNKLQKPIQGRVLNVLQKWVENSFYDFAEDDVLLERLVRFVADNIPTNMFAHKLIKGVRKKKREFKLVLEGDKEAGIEKLFEQILGPTAAGGPEAADAPAEAVRPAKEKKKPKNIIATHLTIRRGHRRGASEGDDEKKLNFLEIGARDLAVQLTLLEQEMFARIRPSELLFGNAGKKNKHQLAPHVMQLVNWFNRIVNWVASVIVVNPNIKERRLVVKRFLEIADECRKLKNFFGLQEIVSALNMACIERLQATWKGMSRQDLALFSELSGLMARGQQNYATYRSEFGGTEPPHLPYIGVHLSDLVALDQLPTWIDPSGSADPKRQHVNFKKMRKLEQAARPMLSCRSYPYTTLEPSWAVHKFLTQDLVVLTPQQLTELSRACEPSKAS